MEARTAGRVAVEEQLPAGVAGIKKEDIREKVQNFRG